MFVWCFGWLVCFFQSTSLDYTAGNKQYPCNRPFPERCEFLQWNGDVTLNLRENSLGLCRHLHSVAFDLVGFVMNSLACSFTDESVTEMRSRHAREEVFTVNLFKKCVSVSKKNIIISIFSNFLEIQEVDYT